MAKKKITELVADLLLPFCEENDYELFHTEYLKEGRDWYLRVYIEKKEGDKYVYVGTDDCEKVSRFLSEKLDELDPIEQNYYLEVSSPGMDRPLLTEKDYVRFSGEMVDIHLYKAIDGKKLVSGRLVGLIEGNIVITDEKGQEIKVSMEQVSKVKLAVIF